jgi:ribosomal-protein-alanine N-acetyltransferase
MSLFETERLILRPFAPGDDRDLHEYLSLAETYRYEPGGPVTLEQARRLCLERSRGTDFVAVEWKENQKLIGHLYFKQIEPAERRTWELGYIFNPKYHRRGFGTEAVAGIVEYGFAERGAHRIMARCDPANIASWRLLEKAGFVREGFFRKFGFVHRDEQGEPMWTDAYEYSRIREEDGQPDVR